MVKQAVKVYVRTRPTTKFAQDKVSIFPDDKKINVKLKPVNRTLNNRKQSHSFRFDGILHNASQEDVFEAVAEDTIKNCYDGYNGTIFCYGQTGAGKTYTMTGPPDNSSDYRRRGIIPRSIEQVFEEVHNRPERSFNLYISYLEIYNEKLFDLLNVDQLKNSDIPSLKNSGNLVIVETGQAEIFVRGLKKFPIKDEEDALALMFEGETQRAICEHVLNSDSSRSHAVFTIYIESRSRVESTGQTMRSKLHLVDLAGSERVKKTKSVGRVLQEAKYINKSLSFLEQVVIALSTPGRSHIPYRQSLLTHFLKDSIGGNSKTSMIANVWCESRHLEETLGTLKFGTRVMRVSNRAVINVELNPSMLLTKYEKQVRDLKRELAMHDQLKGITEVQYDEYTDEQKLQLRKNIWKFVRFEGKVNEGGVLWDGSEEAKEIQEEVCGVKNLRQVKESFLQFRLIVRNLEREVSVMKSELETEKEKVMSLSGGVVPSTTEIITQSRKVSRGKAKATKPSKKQTSGDKSGQSSPSKKKMSKIVVGEEDDKDGFAAGEGIPMKDGTSLKRGKKKAKLARSKIQTTKSKIEDGDESLMEEDEEEGEEDEEDNTPVPSKDEAYENFKSMGHGKELFSTLCENISTHRNAKKEYVNFGKSMNRQKREIDIIKEKINRKKLMEQHQLKMPNSESEENIVDEELLLLYEDLKKLKKGYREAYEERKRLKDELNFLGSRINVLKKKMILEFEKWYIQKFRSKDEEFSKKSKFEEEGEISDSFGDEAKQRKRLRSSNSRFSEVSGNSDDVLDDGEMFEQLEEKRIKKEDPESYTFYKAFQKSKIRKNKNRRRI